MCLRVTVLGAQVYIHTVEVTGSNPVSPTNGKPLKSGAFLFWSEVQPLPKWAQNPLSLTWYPYLLWAGSVGRGEMPYTG